MLVEIVSDEFEGALPRAADWRRAKPLFNRIGLPAPSLENGQIAPTREGGFNLFLNRYGAVVRLYPSQRTAPKGYNFPYSHAYHPLSLPPIGVVRFPEVALQIMPGIAHRRFPNNEIKKAGESIRLDTGECDDNPHNFGAFPQHSTPVHSAPVHMDTVDRVNLHCYSAFHINGTVEPLLIAHKRYDPLQKAFLKAWSGEADFGAFWDKMEAAKNSGFLVAGWNAASAFLPKDRGSIRNTALQYERAALAMEPA